MDLKQFMMHKLAQSLMTHEDDTILGTSSWQCPTSPLRLLGITWRGFPRFLYEMWHRGTGMRKDRWAKWVAGAIFSSVREWWRHRKTACQSCNRGSYHATFVG